MFPLLYEFENGLRLVVDRYLTTCYGPDWWNVSLAPRLPDVRKYAANLERARANMPWIGASARVTVLPIHLITLGQLEQIVQNYQSDCIPQLFPSMVFFLGHMEVVKRIRNLYSHMFPCITKDDCATARREIKTLATHINSRL